MDASWRFLPKMKISNVCAKNEDRATVRIGNGMVTLIGH